MSTPSRHPFHDVLAANELLAGVPDEALDLFAASMPVARYDAESIVFREGDPPSAMYLVLDGTVRISKQGRGGKQETLAMVERGGYFGEMAIVDSQPRSAQASAAEATVLGVVDQDGLSNLLQSAPTITPFNLVRCVTRRLRSANTHFIEEMMRSERLSLVGSMANGIIHDFKNPMAAIMCACEFLQSRESDATARQMADIIRKSVDRMLTMTQELLDFSRGSTQQKWEQAPLSRLIAAIEEISLNPLEQSGYQVERRVEFDGEVVLDFDRFERVLANLLKNSREATPAGGVIRFGVSATGAELAFAIGDTGCGIPEALLPTIFEPFVTHGKKNGTGLGMALVRNVVQAHRGDVSIDTRQGVGTTINIRIPRNLQPGVSTS